MRGMAFAVLCLLGTGVHADEHLAIRAEIADLCMSQASSQDARRDCIGVASLACEATSAGQSNAGLSMCWSSEGAYWDARMNANYQKLLARLESDDEELAELASSALNMAPSLQKMQQAWVDYRDAACAFEVSTWGGGSGAGPAYEFCIMQLTGEQALALEAQVRSRGMN